CPVRENALAPATCSRTAGSGQTQLSKKSMVRLPKATALEENHMTSTAGTARSMLLVETSRSVAKSTATTATMLHHVKALVPGRMINSTPHRPTAAAVHRLQPTRSPRKMAEAAVTVSGLIWLMATRSAKAMRASAD